jgi:protein gp37
LSANSKIEWTGSTWTPIRAQVKDDAGAIATAKGYTSLVQIATKMSGHIGPHCEHASPGCDHCYSETSNGRCLPFNGTGLPFDRRSRDLVHIIIDQDILEQPLHWRKAREIFVCSQTDLFAEFVTDEMIDRVFAVMALCPQHTFQVLTKRADRMRRYISITHDAIAWQVQLSRAFAGKIPCKTIDPFSWPLPNVHLGVSVEDQQRANERHEPMRVLAEQGWTTWVSYEPALELVQWWGWSFLKWVVVGGESGPGARPFDIGWARNTIAQCKAAGVACFVKQLGAKPWDSASSDIDHLFAHCGHACECCDECPSDKGQRERSEHPQLLKLKDRKGGAMDEWPEDLRVRQMPEERKNKQ